MSGTITKPPPNVTVPMRRKMDAIVNSNPTFASTGIAAASAATERRRLPEVFPRPPSALSSVFDAPSSTLDATPPTTTAPSLTTTAPPSTTTAPFPPSPSTLPAPPSSTTAPPSSITVPPSTALATDSPALARTPVSTSLSLSSASVSFNSSRCCSPSLLALRHSRTRSLIFSALFALRPVLRSSGANVSTNSPPV